MTAELEIRTGGALAVAADQTQWTPDQRAALASAGVSEEVSPAELTVFLHECQRTGLDPFSKQIYLIGRNDKQLDRKVFKSQTGIDGYRVVAHRAARRDRVKLGYADTLWAGPDGVWREAWLWDNPPLAAKVTVFRDGEPFPAIATLNEYAEMWNGQLKGMWRRMPANQLAKCAEALALRKAFPHDLGGIYTAEEMGQADNEQQPSTPVRMTPERPVFEGSVEPQQPDPAVFWETDEGKHLLKVLHAVMAAKYGPMSDEQRHAGFTKFAKRRITSAKQLFPDEVRHLIGVLEKMPDFQPAEEPAPASEQDQADTIEARLRERIRDAIDEADINAVLRQAEEYVTVGQLGQVHLSEVQEAANLRRQEFAQPVGASA